MIKNIPMSRLVVDESASVRLYDSATENALRHHISENGQLEPVLVVVHADQYKLMAGYRRYHALSSLGASHIMVRVVADNFDMSQVNPANSGPDISVLYKKLRAIPGYRAFEETEAELLSWKLNADAYVHPTPTERLWFKQDQGIVFSVKDDELARWYKRPKHLARLVGSLPALKEQVIRAAKGRIARYETL
jgi:hypothetical protein